MTHHHPNTQKPEYIPYRKPNNTPHTPFYHAYTPSPHTPPLHCYYSGEMLRLHAYRAGVRAAQGKAWMSVFLRLHGDVVVRDEGLVGLLRKWQEESKRERERVGGLVGYSVGVVGWVRSAR